MGVLSLFTVSLWWNRISLKQWMFWVTFWTAQRGHSAKKARRRRRLVSPSYRKKGSGIVSGLSKIGTGSSALVKHSALVLAWYTYPQENPCFILYPCCSKPSAPAVCLHCQWILFLCASERRAELHSCPCLAEQFQSPWVIALCGPVAGGELLVSAWQSCGLEHPAGMKHVFFLAWVLSKLNVSSVYTQRVWRCRLILV